MKSYKKILSVSLLIITSIGYSQVKIKEKKQSLNTVAIQSEIKTIPIEQLNAIKEKYNWKNERYLIVNFKNLQSICSYDVYEDLVNAYNLYEKKAYEKINLSNSRNIFVYADKDLAKSIIDYKTHYEDIGLYFMKSYFNQDNTCVGVMIINQKGNYLVETEEYNTFTVTNLMEKL